MQLPQHPERDEPVASQPRAKASRGTLIVLTLVGALIVLIVVLHLTGVVGPAAH